jgi:hypothetical protein
LNINPIAVAKDRDADETTPFSSDSTLSECVLEFASFTSLGGNTAAIRIRSDPSFTDLTADISDARTRMSGISQYIDA